VRYALVDQADSERECHFLSLSADRHSKENHFHKNAATSTEKLYEKSESVCITRTRRRPVTAKANIREISPLFGSVRRNEDVHLTCKNFPHTLRSLTYSRPIFSDLLSWMHKACVLCVFWAHASDFVTSRPFLMRVVWSAFE